MKLDFAKIRASLFGGKLTQSQVDGLNTIVQAMNEFKLQDKRQAAYILATTYHETAKTMQPISERGSDTYLSKYDTGKLAAALGNTPQADGDGQKYKGRGYVQLTGAANYRKMSALTGFNLIRQPELANSPKIAAQIMLYGMTRGMFTGKRLSDYINSVKCDYSNARRIINGMDRANDIAEYAKLFDSALSY